ncbi:MAG: hypothetical protein IJS54_07360 [Desulfovibrio sp.]|nr:hypothetical protein [Desulfovibrio sp.]
MNARKIREDIGRVKTSCQRRDFINALILLAGCIKELGGQRVPQDFRTEFREALNSLTSDPTFKQFHPNPIIYKPGGEREILAILIQVYQNVVGKKNTETFEETAERKLRIDMALRDAKNYLSKGQGTDADRSFAEAIKNYRDEYSLFLVIAHIYMDYKEYGRALGYIREGLKRHPQEPSLLRLAETCMQMRADAAK